MTIIRILVAGVLMLLAATHHAVVHAEATHPYPDSAKADLWLVGGQSNMAGYATVLKDSSPDPRVKFFTNQNEWVVLKDPQEPLFFPHGDPHGMVPDYTNLQVVGHGLLLSFSRRLLEHTDSRIGLTGLVTGGSMAQVWDPALRESRGDSAMFAHIIERVKMIGGEGNLKGMIWYQGESDAVQNIHDAPRHKEILHNFIETIREETANPDLPVILVQISRLVPNVLPGLPGKSPEGEEVEDIFGVYSRNWDMIQEAQRQVADELEYVYPVATVDLYPFVDPIHLDYEAFERLGPRIAEIALGEVYGLPDHASPIRLESAKIVESIHPVHKYVIENRTTIEVKFSGVNGRLKAPGRPAGFELHYPEIDPEIARATVPIIYGVDFVAGQPDTIHLRCTGPIPNILGPVHLYYGKGLNPYCNIVDEKDIAVLAFGPIEIEIQ